MHARMHASPYLPGEGWCVECGVRTRALAEGAHTYPAARLLPAATGWLMSAACRNVVEGRRRQGGGDAQQPRWLEQNSSRVVISRAGCSCNAQERSIQLACATPCMRCARTSDSPPTSSCEVMLFRVVSVPIHSPTSPAPIKPASLCAACVSRAPAAAALRCSCRPMQMQEGGGRGVRLLATQSALCGLGPAR